MQIKTRYKRTIILIFNFCKVGRQVHIDDESRSNKKGSRNGDRQGARIYARMLHRCMGRERVNEKETGYRKHRASHHRLKIGMGKVVDVSTRPRANTRSVR